MCCVFGLLVEPIYCEFACNYVFVYFSITGEGLRWSWWIGFQCWTTNISHQPTVEPPASTLHSLVYLAQAGMKVLLQTQNPTLKTLVVVPPAGRTNSLLSSSGTPLETWRFLRCGDTKWAQCGVGSALELMVLISRAQTEMSVFEVFVFICYRPFSSAFEKRAVTVYNGDSMVTFFPPPAACGAPGSAWGFAVAKFPSWSSAHERMRWTALPDASCE